MVRDGQKWWVCKTLRQCNFLIDHGFECAGTSVDIRNPKYRVFLFDMTVPGFKEALDEWLERVKKFKNE